MTSLENPDAGQGPVLLDIGGDVGALVVTMPARTEGLEVEIRPAGATEVRLAHDLSAPSVEHGTAHDHSPGDHGHAHARTPYPHVGVVGRAVPGGVHHSLVYPAVTAGDYELCPIPGDDVVLRVRVIGGEVTELDWPG